MPMLRTLINASDAPSSRACDASDGIESSLYRFILRHSAREQLILVILTALSFPVLYYSLELPKTIINHAIGGKSFPKALFGVELDQIPYLLTLCGIYLLLIVANGLLKFYVNVRKGRLGDRMLQRLRYGLYLRILRFPLQQFTRTPSGEIITMLTAELEPVAGFIGDALALPLFQGGTLATIVVFLFIQNPLLGVAALMLYPVQAYAIPGLQKKVRELGRLRIRKIRELADRCAESIGARVDIRVGGDAPYQLADISNRLLGIYRIRYDIYYRKFFAKFLNNFLTQLTPFFFYALGGYFVITGQLSFGALVAVLAAYKDMSDPWKELLNFYQDQQDVAIKYEQVIRQFDAAGMLDPQALLATPPSWPRFNGQVEASNLTYHDSEDISRLEGASFSFHAPAHVAIVGPENGGKAELATLLAGLDRPTMGRMTMSGTDLASLPISVLGRWIGYVGSTSYLFDASVQENLRVGLRHRPPFATEALRSAATTYIDLDADWLDYEQAGTDGWQQLRARMIDVIRLVGLGDDLYEFGLHGRVEVAGPDAAARFVDARRRLEADLSQVGASAAVERWDPDRFNVEAAIAENLLFGTATGPELEANNLPQHPYFRRVIGETGLTPDLLRLGAEASATMVEAFGDIDTHFVDEFSLIRRQELPEFRALHARLSGKDPARISEADARRLLGVALRIIPARHRFDNFTDQLASRIVEARHRFAANLRDDLQGAVCFFDENRYNGGATVYDNILFGKLAGDIAKSRATVHAVGGRIADELALRDLIIGIGLDHSVGTGGARLSPEQRQKVALARAVLKRPHLLVLNQALSGMSSSVRTTLVGGLRREFAGRYLVCTLADTELACSFDQIIVVRDGRIVEIGPPEKLRGQDSEFSRLTRAA